jgi:hypothetical protein
MDEPRASARYSEPMKHAVLARPLLGVLALVFVGACATDTAENTNMGSNPKQKPSGSLQADPHFYKLNSVMGEITSGGRPVKGATVTIVKTSESFPVEESGSYVIVLDPVRLGGRRHELAFSAPGYAEQRHFVLVPENNQTRLDVDLVAKKK